MRNLHVDGPLRLSLEKDGWLATRAGRREKVPVRVIMAIGGWPSYSAIEPYSTEPSEKNIIEAMTSVS